VSVQELITGLHTATATWILYAQCYWLSLNSGTSTCYVEH
jgi:hypothetical protein